MDPIAAAIERLRTEKDSEARGEEARWLGEHGDARAFEPLEHAVLHDDGTWYEEGGFADRINSVADVSLGALKKLSERIAPTAGDGMRRRLLLERQGAHGHALDLLFRALGASVKSMLDDGVENPDASIRARAITIRDGLEAALDHPDEDVRFAAMSRNPDGTSLYRCAMERFSREPSARVKRAIFDVWLRVDGGRYRIGSRTAMMFLALAEDDVRKRMARIVLDGKIDPPKDERALKEIAHEVLGIPKPAPAKPVVETKPAETKPAEAKPVNKYTALLMERREWRAKAIADAIREAAVIGKEPFDWERFKNSGAVPHGEDEHVYDYYVSKSEMRTMAEYIAYRKEMDPWEDCR